MLMMMITMTVMMMITMTGRVKRASDDSNNSKGQTRE